MCKSLPFICAVFLFISGCADNIPKATQSYSVINTQSMYGDFEGLVFMQPPGMKLDTFLINVGVSDAPYDKLYTTNPYIVPWVFHLGKVRMDLQVERLRDGYYISADYPPGTTFDGMSRKDRMGDYYDHMGDLLKEKNKALKKLNDKYFK